MHKLCKSHIIAHERQLTKTMFNSSIDDQTLTFDNINPRYWTPSHTKEWIKSIKVQLNMNVDIPMIERESGDRLITFDRNQFIECCPISPYFASELYEQLHNRLIRSYHRDRYYNVEHNLNLNRALTRIKHLENVLVTVDQNLPNYL